MYNKKNINTTNKTNTKKEFPKKNVVSKKVPVAAKPFADDSLNKAQAFFEKKLKSNEKTEQQFFRKLDRQKGILPSDNPKKPFDKTVSDSTKEYSPVKKPYPKKTTEDTKYNKNNIISDEEKRPYNTKEKNTKNTYAPRNPKAKQQFKSNEIKPTPDGNIFKSLSKTAKTLPTSKREETKMPLNKYIAHAGICGRRDAAELIKKGDVKVNGVVLREPGYKVQANDVIIYQGKELKNIEKSVYYLLNKPKGFITTTEDERDRKTVLDLMHTVEERIFPVGRLDRATTGLILLTNDGDLSQKLAHPKNGVKKVYQVLLDKNLTPNHAQEILNGLLLEDGKAIVDELAFINQENKKEIGIEIHQGKNRIVRRIFEHLGYEVLGLDRVMYAGLTKKNLPRGKYRMLTPKEIIYLKHY